MEPRTYYKAGYDPVTAVSPSAWRLLEADGYSQSPDVAEAQETADDSAGVVVAALEDDDAEEIPFATPLPKRGRKARKGDGGVL
jgi:hypothetical protein